MTAANFPSDHEQKRYLQLAIVNILAFFWLVGKFAFVEIDAPDMAGCAKGVIDLHAFWGAGQLALQGTPLDAFDIWKLQQSYDGCKVGELRWLHPAHFMPVATLIAAIPFYVSWVLINTLSMLALALTLRPYCKGEPQKFITIIFIAVVFSHAMYAPILLGQLTLLWIAGLLAALTAIRSGKPILAGILIGILTFKPTLGLLIPFMLLAISHWKTIIAASVTTITLVGGATAYYGLGYWTAWREAVDVQGAEFISQMATNKNFGSFGTLLAKFGFTEDTALTCNLILAAILAIVVFVVWRRLGAKSNAAAALLFAAIPLASPYLWYYDAAFLPITALFLLRHKGWQAKPLYWLGLGLLWIGPGLSMWNESTIDASWLVASWVVPLQLLLGLGMALYAVAKADPPTDKHVPNAAHARTDVIPT